MSRYVAFIGTSTDADLAQKYYGDAEVIRFGLHTVEKLGRRPLSGSVWVDGAVDGLDKAPPSTQANDTDTPVGRWESYIKQFPGWEKIGDPSFQEKPVKNVVENFVRSVLDRCLESQLKARWLSVPQLPVANGTRRNKINSELAKATRAWRNTSQFHGKLILPIILTHQDQINLKTARTPRVETATKCYERASADGYWVVESSLSDQKGERTFDKKRFPALIQFHEELVHRIPNEAISVGGPYWGMNLVLWARGLVSYPAIGIGGRYQYHLPGGQARNPKTRVALPPLRRWAIWGPKLQEWLNKISKVDPDLAELRDLSKDFSRFGDESQARAQVARFYKAWFDSIESVSQAGRGFALYQDLSRAYVLGKSLQDLPDDEKTARRPERIAEILMLQCL